MTSSTIITEEYHLQALLDHYHGPYVTRRTILGQIAAAIVWAKARHLDVKVTTLFPASEATQALFEAFKPKISGLRYG